MFSLDSGIMDCPSWTLEEKNKIKELNEILMADRILYKELIKRDNLEFKKILEFHICNSRGWNIGFIDLAVFVSHKYYNSEYFYQGDKDGILHGKPVGDFYFEIKPEIKSVGEVIRQLNFYRTYLQGNYIIVTKTTGLKEIFKSQGIYVFEYDDKKISETPMSDVINEKKNIDTIYSHIPN
jgi:hypothetical protein